MVEPQIFWISADDACELLGIDAEMLPRLKLPSIKIPSGDVQYEIESLHRMRQDGTIKKKLAALTAYDRKKMRKKKCLPQQSKPLRPTPPAWGSQAKLSP